jgi:alanine dehydrogenase
MLAYLESLDIAGVKIVNSHPRNPSLHGLPTVMAIILLNDPRTGIPLVLMDGTYITSLRTGAASAVATEFLSRRASRILGIIGAGGQSFHQLEAISLVRDLKEIRIYDLDQGKAKGLSQRVKKDLGVDAKPVRRVEEAVRGVDILVTITPSRKPIVEDAWVSEGIHINAIGADAKGKQELDPEILKRAKIVVDDLPQAIHSGEINLPLSQGLLKVEDIYGTICEVVAGKKKGRERAEEITVFDSTGLAIQDISTATTVFRRAEEMGLGMDIELFQAAP